MGGQGLEVNDYLSVRAGVVATRAYRVVYLSVRAGVVATRAYRVVQQQGCLGFEGSTRRDFAKLGGQTIKVVKGLVQGRMETAVSPRSWQVPSTRAGKLYEGCTLLAVCSESICGGHNYGAENARRVCV